MYRLISTILVLLSCLSAGAQLHKAPFWLGADTGWDSEMAAAGHKFYNWRGEERECTALMKEMGLNAIRIRVWVDPSKHGNWCNSEDVLQKALRAKQQGMEVMIDFHYSDWWADPSKQNIPAAWAKHSYKQMLKDLAAHTRDVLTLLLQNGVSPRWVQVGNETSNGLLWSVEMDPVTGWEKKDEHGRTTITHSMGHLERNPKQYPGFIRAGYDAVKSVCPEAQVIVHLDNGYDNDLYNRNLDVLLQGGAKWDLIGMSLYPYWSMEAGNEPSAMKTIVDCVRNIKKVVQKYGTDVIITETGFEVDETQPWKMVAGREQLRELIQRCQNETDGHCLGVFYWEPECRPSQYKLGAFTEDGHPTDIMRAFNDVNPQPTYDRQRWTISTTEGDITVELYNETPHHRDNFVRWATEHLQEGKPIHRVIENFVVQGGDTLLTDHDSVPCEILYPRFFHKRGALAAAREGDENNPQRNSSDYQFYIAWGTSPAREAKRAIVPMLGYYTTTDRNPGLPMLDANYSVYGEVVSGLDVVARIQQLPTDSGDHPLKEVKILNIKRTL